MVARSRENKNCAYAWMDHIISPEANAAVAEYFGEAPANAKACDLAAEGHCETFHAGDEDYASQIWYWTTPIEQCLDGRTDVKCTDYGDWTHGLDRGQGLISLTSSDLSRRPGLRVGLLLTPPMLWLGVAYLGALGALFITSLWTQNDFTGNIERVWTLDNFGTCSPIEVYRTITLRTIGIAAAGHGHRRGPGVPDRALHGQGRLAADAAAAGDRGADAAVGVVPREGLRLARDALRGRADRLDRGAVRARHARATG